MSALGMSARQAGSGHKRPVVDPPESSRIMPLALFECLQGFWGIFSAECGQKDSLI